MLQKLYRRYEKVRTTYEYRAIARLGSFKSAQESLSSYIKLLGGTPAVTIEPA